MVTQNMDVDVKETTSRTSMLKLMIVKAWRERWTDAQWGINVKTVLPRGVSGDVHNLADCILQQAVIGFSANKLILSYLRHSLYSHVISHAAVLKQISNYESKDKVHCIISLMEFLESIIDGVTCRGKAEESILSKSLLSVIYWISNILDDILIKNLSINLEEQNIIEHSGNIIGEIVKNDFLMGCIYVGIHENKDLHLKIKTKYSNIVSGAKMIRGFAADSQNQRILDGLQQLAFIDVTSFNITTEFSVSDTETISYCMQPIMSIEVLLFPGKNTKTLVKELLMIKQLKNFKLSRLYYEIIRSCLTSLHSVVGTSRESIWCAFTYKKVPDIFKQMHQLSSSSSNATDFATDIMEAFKMLENEPILYYIDTKYACNTLDYLMKELIALNFFDLKDVVIKSRENTIELSKFDQNFQEPSLLLFVLKAPPLTHIFKALVALNADYNKHQDSLLEMLFQVLSSFDVILSVATVEGKIKTLTSRLIKCNEMSIKINNETPDQCSLLFDISFLMLAFIMQTCGSDDIIMENGDSFFEKWLRDSMIDRNKRISPMLQVQLCDSNKVDELLLHLNSSESEPKPCTLKWHEMCMNIPAVLYHILIAWENEAISATEVKNSLDSIKMKLSSLSVCAASWLCSYMQIVQHDELLKPMNMLQQLLQPSNCDELTSSSSDSKTEKRHGLSFQIIRKMQLSIHPAPKPKSNPIMLTNNLVSQIPLQEQFNEVWQNIATVGRLPVERTQTLENLLQSCGPYWLVSKLVNEIFQCKHTNEMLQTMDIVFGIMHLDIEKCTIALLSEFLPTLLLNTIQKQEFHEPQSPVLARLCVYCILATMAKPNDLNNTTGTVIKQEEPDKLMNNNNSNSNNNGCSISKVRKLNTSSESSTTTDKIKSEFLYDNNNITSTSSQLNDEQSVTINTTSSTSTLVASTSTSATASILNTTNTIGGNTNIDFNITVDTLSESLQISIGYLFKVFNEVILSGYLSPKTYFIYQFLTILIQCGKDRTQPILKLIPNGLIQNLFKVLVTEEFPVGFIISMYDLTTIIGRTSAMSDLCLLRNMSLRRQTLNI